MSSRVKIVLAAILLLAIGLIALRQRDFDPENDQVAIPEPDNEETPIAYASPEIRAVRHTASGDIEIVWDAREVREQGVEYFTLDVWDLTNGIIYYRDLLPAESNSHTFIADKSQSAVYTIFVNAFFSETEKRNSDPWQFDYEMAVNVEPEQPESLQATWKSFNGQAVVELEWPSASVVGGEMAGYFVLADDEIEGVLLELHSRPMTGHSSHFQLKNTEARDIVFAVSSVDQTAKRSVPQTIRVSSPASNPPIPLNLRATDGSSSGASVLVSWEYSNQLGLLGFRLFDHGLLVADETELAADTRTTLDTNPLPDWDYLYSLQAVFDGGYLSENAVAHTYASPLNAKDVPPPRPTGLSASWVRENEQLEIYLRWDSAAIDEQVDGYRLSMAPNVAEEFEIVRSELIDASEFVLKPADLPQEAVFRLQAIGVHGAASDFAETFVPDPALFAFPPRLINYKVREQQNQILIVWEWRYPDSPLLTGFRMYLDGELIADESSITREARSWKVGPFEEGRAYSFEIEAVMAGGTRSKKAPPQIYYHETQGRP